VSLWRGRLMDFHHSLAGYVAELRARADSCEEVARLNGFGCSAHVILTLRDIADELERRFPAPVDAEALRIPVTREGD